MLITKIHFDQFVKRWLTYLFVLLKSMFEISTIQQRLNCLRTLSLLVLLFIEQRKAAVLI